MDLSTTYMGLELANPLIPSCAAPASARDEGEWVRRLAEAGAPALLMDPIYEEQISCERSKRLWYEQVHSRNDPGTYVAQPPGITVRGGTRRDYLKRIEAIKTILPEPLIAAINCMSLRGDAGGSDGSWVDYAGSIETAGADALELNVYVLPTNPEEPALDVERRLFDTVAAVRARVKIPVAVKLSPFYTSLPHLARRLESADIHGLVLFSRFYEPEFEEGMKVRGGSGMDSIEMRLRLSWLSILSPQTRFSLALSGGVQTGRDVMEGLRAGADAVQISLSVLNAGPEYLETVLDGLIYHMEQAGYESIERLCGCVNQREAVHKVACINGTAASRTEENTTVSVHLD